MTSESISTIILLLLFGGGWIYSLSKEKEELKRKIFNLEWKIQDMKTPISIDFVKVLYRLHFEEDLPQISLSVTNKCQANINLELDTYSKPDIIACSLDIISKYSKTLSTIEEICFSVNFNKRLPAENSLNILKDILEFTKCKSTEDMYKKLQFDDNSKHGRTVVDDIISPRYWEHLSENIFPQYLIITVNNKIKIFCNNIHIYEERSKSDLIIDWGK